MGQIASAANSIEKSLANMIPLLIGFLAQLLGLGGISKKIKETIEKIQSAVDKAIDKAIAKIVAVVKKLILEEGRWRRMESRMSVLTPRRRLIWIRLWEANRC